MTDDYNDVKVIIDAATRLDKQAIVKQASDLIRLVVKACEGDEEE